MKEDYKNNHQEGGGAAGLRILFQSRGAGGVSLRLGGLGSHPPHGKGPGWGFRTRWQDGLWGGSCGGNLTGSGRAPRRRCQGRRWGCRRRRNAFGDGRTRSHSTLLNDHY